MDQPLENVLRDLSFVVEDFQTFDYALEGLLRLAAAAQKGPETRCDLEWMHLVGLTTVLSDWFANRIHGLEAVAGQLTEVAPIEETDWQTVRARVAAVTQRRDTIVAQLDAALAALTARVDYPTGGPQPDGPVADA